MWISNLVPGTTYSCVLSARNAIGGYDQVLQPVNAYRDDETIFERSYDFQSTDPTYPDPVSGLTCTPTLDPVSDPGTEAVGTDVAAVVAFGGVVGRCRCCLGRGLGIR